MAMDKSKVIKISVGVAVLAAIGGVVWYFLKDSKDAENSKLLKNKAPNKGITGGVVNTLSNQPTSGNGPALTYENDTGTANSDASAEQSIPQDDGLVDLSLFDKSGKPTVTVRVSPDVYDTLMKFLPAGQGDAWRSLPTPMAVAFAMAFWWEYYWREKKTDIDHSPGASNFIRSKGIANWGKSAGMNANITGTFFDKYGRPNNNGTPIPVTFSVPLPNLSGYVYQTVIVPSSSIKGYYG